MLRVLPAHGKLALQQVTYTSAYEVATAPGNLQQPDLWRDEFEGGWHNAQHHSFERFRKNIAHFTEA